MPNNTLELTVNHRGPIALDRITRSPMRTAGCGRPFNWSLGITMKQAANVLIVLALGAGARSAHASEELNGAWTLRIQDLNHREVAVATIRFSDERATSCMGGGWRRVLVDTVETKDASFFPLSEPLSYTLDGSELRIGRNEICDAYLHLRGTFDGSVARGIYTGFGITGGNKRGEFELTRRR